MTTKVAVCRIFFVPRRLYVAEDRESSAYLGVMVEM